jgi:hypothetical protein
LSKLRIFFLLTPFFQLDISTLQTTGHQLAMEELKNVRDKLDLVEVRKLLKRFPGGKSINGFIFSKHNEILNQA